MKDVIHRIQRELPDTDHNRYDIAYKRGRAQARSGFLFGGLALGSAIGAGLTFLLDPERGKARRAELSQRATGLKNDVARMASGRAEDLQNRARGFAIEHDLKEPPTSRSADGQRPVAGSAATAEEHVVNEFADEFGEGYKEGFGRTEYDPEAPGAQVTDPIRSEETAEYGSSGPVAGATHEYRESEVKPLSEEERAVSR